MADFFAKNVSLFSSRFPELLNVLNLEEKDFFVGGKIGGKPNPEILLSDSEIEIIPSKIPGVFTAKSGGKLLHSLYNPLREAQMAAEGAKKSKSEISSCAFFGFGLGFSVIEYARKYPGDALLLVEPDPRAFFTALRFADWSSVFSLRNVVLALATGADVVVSLIEKFGGLSRCAVVANPSHTAHAQTYFHALKIQLERNADKDRINRATLERFGGLWRRNIGRNSAYIEENSSRIDFRNVSEFSGGFCGKPFVVLAAGPTLREILPFLREIKERAVLVAVDTALRQCLKAGVEPDFVVLCDPQYYAYAHVAGLSSPSSTLVTEIAAYPSVFRFKCRAIALCASNCPLELLGFGEKFVENDRKRGILSSGGSVSTTAWDFARLCGSTEIYFAGLDLGFPSGETHARGSTFEERAHFSSSRLNTAETAFSSALFGANMVFGTDYSGRKILTDNRMKMFAWWFESKCTEFPEIRSFSFSDWSLRIPGFSVASIQEFLRSRLVTLTM